MSSSPSLAKKKKGRQLPPESDEDDEEDSTDAKAAADADLDGLIQRANEQEDEFDEACAEYDKLVEEAQDYFADDDWEYVAPGAPMSWITERRCVGSMRGMIAKIQDRLEACKSGATPSGSDAGDAPSGEEEDDDEEEEEERYLEPAAVEPNTEQAEASTVSGHEAIAEEKCTNYGSVPYGVNPQHIVHDGEEIMEFPTAKAMNDMLNSKSPERWKDVRTKHIWVLRNNDRNIEGWWEGKPDAPQREQLPYEMFFYICCFVTPDPADPESMLRAESDKKVLRHLHRQVAVKLHERFDKALKSEESRAQKKIILDWRAASVPQVEPRVVGWVPYKSVILPTAFIKRESNPRVKGSQKRALVVKPPVPRGGFTKRAAEQMDVVDDAEGGGEEGEGAASTSTQDLNAWKNGRKEDTDYFPSSRKAGFKRHRTFTVANGAATHVYVQGNLVHVVEH
jgi:hypothetical protein